MQGSRMISLIVQTVLYYIGWFACIIYAAKGEGNLAASIIVGIVVLQYLLQRCYVKQTVGLHRMMFLFVLVGSLIDLAFLKLNLVHFASNPWGVRFIPLWMVGIWLEFAMIFYAALSFLFKRYILLGFLSFFLFPLAYTVGAKLGAASFPHGYASSMVLGLVWALLLPCCMMLFNASLKRDGYRL